MQGLRLERKHVDWRRDIRRPSRARRAAALKVQAKGSFVFSKMTPGIIPANKNLYKLTNDSGREFFLEVIPRKTSGA